VDVVGEGEFLPDLQKLSRDLNIEKYINFRGWLTYEKVPETVAMADVGLAPMSDDVGLPNKLFEYFALGKPAIVSAQPSLLSAFGDNGPVTFFEPDNEIDLAQRIVEVYRSPEKRAALVDRGYKFYAGCQWSILKYDYLKGYEELTAN